METTAPYMETLNVTLDSFIKNTGTLSLLHRDFCFKGLKIWFDISRVHYIWARNKSLVIGSFQGEQTLLRYTYSRGMLVRGALNRGITVHAFFNKNGESFHRGSTFLYFFQK